MRETLFEYCQKNNKQFLLDEWDYEKNNAIGLFVEKISYGSGKIANWICANEHNYQKRIDARTSNNSKCPYCESNKKQLLIGFNDLATTYPKLLDEWDNSKNTTLDPHHIMATSTKRVWWLCKECGNSGQTPIRQRALVGKGCPYCAHLLPIKSVNDLQTLFPDLIKDWDFTKNVKKPDEYTAYSGQKVWWKCHFCGYEWRTAINNRTANKRNCPGCTMKSTSFGEQALFYYIKKIYPDAVNRYHGFGIELDIYIPSISTGIEFDGIFWHDNENSRLREENKYSVCKQHNIRLIRIGDSKAQLHENTCDYSFRIDNLSNLEQLNNIIRIVLKEIDPASNKWTRKNPRQIWSSIDQQINVDKDRFEILENKYLREEMDSFVYNYPEVYKEWNYDRNGTLNPKAFTKSSTKKVWWKCSDCGAEWEATINDMTSGHSNCPVCNNRRLVVGVNDFATLYPSILDEWDYKRNSIKPNEILKRNKTKVWWVCKKCGHNWMATLGDRTRTDKPSGCPNCKIDNASKAKHDRALKRGSFAEKFPELLNEWDYDKNAVSPDEISPGSNIYVWRKCRYCGNSWQTSLNNWARKQAKCPKCKKR